MPLNDWLSRIARVTGCPRTRLEDPCVLEEAIADLWLGDVVFEEGFEEALPAPPTLALPQVSFAGLQWSRCLVDHKMLAGWGVPLPHQRANTPPDAPAIGVSLALARELAHAQGGRLPRVSEWEAAVADSAPGNHGMRWGGPSAPGTFPAARSGLLDGWGNAWEWTEEGVAVGGSFASPPHPAPQTAPRLTSFRIVR